MTTKRWDETWHRLLNWTNGSAPSERLAAQVLLSEGFKDIDPSHPLGGPDSGRDALATRDGNSWLMAVYFPRRQQSLKAIKDKLKADSDGVASNNAHGLVFVTNQEITVSDREALRKSVKVPLELYHLERLTAVLDQPRMGPVRRQFGLEDPTDHLEALQTGGDTYCHVMLYNFDLGANLAREFVVIRNGDYPLYDLRIRIRDMNRNVDVWETPWGELNAAADYTLVKWQLQPEVYYRIFFFARNGNWHQDFQLRKSVNAKCWLAATRVRGHQQIPEWQHLDNGYEKEFGPVHWRE